MNQTQNYKLNQWSKDDRVLMDDFNADNAKIDGALKAEADARKAETAALAAKVEQKADLTALAGVAAKIPASHLSCCINLYNGSGTGSQTFTFPGRPLLVIAMMNSQGFFAIQGRGLGTFSNMGSASSPLSVSWSGNSVTMSQPGGFLSPAGNTGTVLALIET